MVMMRQGRLNLMSLGQGGRVRMSSNPMQVEWNLERLSRKALATQYILIRCVKGLVDGILIMIEILINENQAYFFRVNITK